MTNISSLEIAELRPFFATALQQLQAIQAQPQEISEDPDPDPAHADDTDITVRRAAASDVPMSSTDVSTLAR